MKSFKFFIGVDVSKLTLDFSIYQSENLIYHKSIPNQILDIKELLKEFRQIPTCKNSNTVFGMENTGVYSNLLISILQKAKANFTVENAVHIRNSLGNIRGKTDKIDSQRIAMFLFKNRDRLNFWKPRRPVIEELKNLVTLRTRLSSIQVALKTPLKENARYISKTNSKQHHDICQNTITSISSDLEILNELIKKVWSSDEKIKNLMKIITSVRSIGEVTALHIILSSNEFEDIDTGKKFACYAGVAPFHYKSGTSVSKKTRVSDIANKKIKSLLHMCAVSAIRYNDEMKDYFIRKTQVEGKNKMLVLNAVRSKLILRVFSCVKANKLYVEGKLPLKSNFEDTKTVYSTTDN
ncbi:MAG: IS110 family transposase [Pedobacter sp.]|nr:MAG: IS110 family transposase [Pedobacter sp.]